MQEHHFKLPSAWVSVNVYRICLPILLTRVVSRMLAIFYYICILTTRVNVRCMIFDINAFACHKPSQEITKKCQAACSLL